jgi:hypothetical protein
VILSDSDRSATARAGTELTMTSGSITSRAMASDADPWAWTALVAPPVDFEGLTLAEFVARLAREEGWNVRYEDNGLAREAAGIVLHGSASGLSARQAVEVAISTSGLEHRFEGRELAILRRAGQR